jgi:hypothetical protein
MSRSTIGAEVAEPLGALFIVDDDRPEDDIMKEPATVIEKAHEQDKRRQGGDRDPEQNRLHVP